MIPKIIKERVKYLQIVCAKKNQENMFDKYPSCCQPDDKIFAYSWTTLIYARQTSEYMIDPRSI